VPLALAALALPGCGLQPLYSGGAHGPTASILAQIEVPPMPGKAGFLMGNALKDRLPSGGGTPAYRLDVKLDDQIVGIGVRRDDSISRERRTLRARYQLIDLSTGQVVLDATAGSDSGIDVVTSEYAVIAAENTALEHLTTVIADQIVTRIAVYARQRKG